MATSVADFNFALKMIALSFKARVRLVRNGDKYTYTTKYLGFNKSDTFKLGEEENITTTDGRKVKVVYTMDGNTLTEKQTGEKSLTWSEMASKPILYYINRSPPCRAVLMAAKYIGVELDLKIIDSRKGENRTPQFLKMNPQHTVPVLDDNGALILDSHAICSYLSEKYAKDDKLYPKDLVKRALVDARLHFDTGFLFARLRAFVEPIFYFGCTEISQERSDYFKMTLPIVEAFLENCQYVCGNDITLADFCFISTLSSVDRIIGIDAEKYPKTTDWMRRMSQLPDYENLNGEGASILQDAILAKIKENQEAAKSN
ncbi:Glutathione S-transferase 1, isoform C [Pseudolycoriella hygida]|uniref:glutathione transferase n=1 Tax=Pseudolycoriella hygida TaxID=35572 RepID=A0A9Q0S2Y4_9DIPT|nr:Glutathione S-transferase 1, isoform C [Pseudolycoriella hygida]